MVNEGQERDKLKEKVHPTMDHESSEGGVEL
jgi:hypothetical protein